MSRRVPVWTRAATTTPSLSLFLVLVIAALSYLGAAAPTMLADGRTATVQRAVASLPDLVRWPSATEPGLPAFDDVSDEDDGVWGSALDAVDQKRQAQPEPLRGLLGDPHLTLMVDPLPTTDEDPSRVEPVPRNKVGLVSDPGLADRVSLVDGRMPEITDPGAGIEIALTEPIAEQLAWQVGTARRWDGTTLTLTGIIAPSDPDDGDWAFISGSVSPLIEVNASGDRTLVVAGFMHVDEAAALTDRVRDIKITAWMPFDTTAIDAATAAQTAAQLRLLAAGPVDLPMYAETFYNRGLAFASSLPRALDTGIARADAMTAVIAVAAVGPLTVALVVLALVSRLIAVRRVTSSRVLRARGASTGRLVAMLGGEGVVLGLLGAVAGAGAAVVAPGWTGWWVILVPVAFAVVPAVALPWSALSDAARRGRHDLGEKGRAGSGRMALEALTLVVTAVLCVLIVGRGAATGVDPLLLMLPVLLGLSGSILALRLLPMLLRLAEGRGRRRAPLTGLLGPARARRDPVVRTAPVLAVVVGLGVAIFSVAFAATVSGGIVRAAAIGVGADVRVDAAHITEDAADDVAALDGVTSMAALRGDSSEEASSGAQKTRAHVYAVDRDAFVAVQDDPATALPLPAALADPADEAVPVVASEQLLARLGVHDPNDAELEMAGVPVRVVGTAQSQVPFGAAEQWVIIDAAHAEALGLRGSGLSQLYLALAPDADPDAVGAAAATVLGGDARFETPARVAAVHAEDPGLGVVRGALLAAGTIVLVLLAVAVIATLVLGASSRARMLAILRTLGHPPGAAGKLVTWEVAPALLLAVPFGVGAGVLMAQLVIAQLDLRGFVGGPTQPEVLLGGAWPLLIVAGFVLVAGVAVVVAALLASRLDASSAIREDEREQ